MPALLALIPAKDWFYGALIVGLLIFGVHLHHKILAEGIAKQQAADAQASAVLVKQTAAQTAELQAKATMAEQAYDKEIGTVINLPAPSVRLCVYPHPGGSVVPQAGAAVGGNAGAGTAAGNLQPLPAGSDSGGATAGPDIGNLLSILSLRADEVSATLREFQSR
jgi:hypothetical protein